MRGEVRVQGRVSKRAQLDLKEWILIGDIQSAMTWQFPCSFAFLHSLLTRGK